MPTIGDPNTKSKKVTKFKREPLRPWDNLESFKITQESENKTGSINQVYEPGLSTGSINQVYEPDSSRSINPVYKPISETGSINRVDKRVLLNGVDRPVSLSIADLRGNPLKTLEYLFLISKDNEGSVTKKFTRMDIVKALEISTDSVKTAFKFLKENNLIEKVAGKEGRFGWSQYRIKKELFEELITRFKTGLIDPINRIGSISSSSYINKTTTTELPAEWKEIDLTEFEKNFSFGISQLKQIHKDGVLTSTDLMESLTHFNHDVISGTLKKDKPLGYLMTILRSGYTYVSENMRTEKAKILDEMKRRREETEKMNEAIEHEKFLLWLETQDKEMLAEKMDNFIREEWRKKGNKSITAISFIKSNIYRKKTTIPTELHTEIVDN